MNIIQLKSTRAKWNYVSTTKSLPTKKKSLSWQGNCQNTGSKPCTSAQAAPSITSWHNDPWTSKGSLREIEKGLLKLIDFTEHWLDPPCFSPTLDFPFLPVRYSSCGTPSSIGGIKYIRPKQMGHAALQAWGNSVGTPRKSGHNHPGFSTTSRQEMTRHAKNTIRYVTSEDRPLYLV